MEQFHTEHLLQEFHECKEYLKTNQQRIQTLFAIEDKVRLQYGLPLVSEDIRQVGIGGPQLLPTMEEYHLLNQHLENDLERLSSGIERLRRQVDLQKATLYEAKAYITLMHQQLQSQPSILPIADYRLTSGFGIRHHPFKKCLIPHCGIDLASYRWSPVYATADGIVKFSDFSGDLGNLVIISHFNNLETL